MSGSQPSIRISRPSQPIANATPAMSIPSAQEFVPPPLPPPKFVPEIIGLDTNWQWSNQEANGSAGRPAPVKPGSSLHGGAPSKSSWHEKEQELPQGAVDRSRRGSSISTITANNRDLDMADDATMYSDEDGSASRRASSYRLQGEKPLEQRTLELSSNTYDKQLVSRIGGPNGPNTPKRGSISYAPGSMQETAQLAHAESERRNSQLRPLSLPDRRLQTSLDSPASSRWPPSGATSPGFIEHGPPEHSRFQTRHGSVTFDDTILQRRGSCDPSAFNRDEVMEDAHTSSLNIHDRSPGAEDYAGVKTGMKRRASSPPRERSREDRLSMSSASGQFEPYPRLAAQQQLNRNSPVSRFHTSHSSLSSVSSFAPRHGSLGSSLGIASIPSSTTSYGSGRLSPNALSPAFDPELVRGGPPYNHASTQMSLGPVNSGPQHHHSLSDGIAVNMQPPLTENMPHARNGSMSHLQGMYICECCPKKPKKFDTEEELRLHESEKQYSCAYCPNRFKNKNEAERHQNSLHLRRHSWSCAALAGIEAAFHASLSGNGSDVCGYCGAELPNPPQWDMRAEHLNHVHKFGECNQAKKFFRADHFRQHLKHSHAGTSGKWTNMLENACMKDEPLPEKRMMPGMPPIPGDGPPAPTMAPTSLPEPQQTGGATPEASMKRES